MKITVSFNVNCRNGAAAEVSAAIAEAVRKIEAAGAKKVSVGVKPKIAFEAAVRESERMARQNETLAALETADGKGSGRKVAVDGAEGRAQIEETIQLYRRMREKDPRISLLSAVKEAIANRVAEGKALPFKSVSSLYYKVYREVKGGQEIEMEES